MKIKPDIIFKVLFISLIVIFLVIYIYYENGYGVYLNYKKSSLTAEKIKQFEEDVASGKKIDVNDYFEEEVDVTNKISRASLDLSNKIGMFVKKSLINIFKYINKLIE